MAAARVRRAPDEARRVILEASEQLLVEGGLGAVQMRSVAARLGVTDSAIAHHFGNRAGLLAALLRHGGRKLHGQVAEVVARWNGEQAGLGALVDLLGDLHASGYAELALALHQAGQGDSGKGFLNPVVDALHERRRRVAATAKRPPPAKRETRVAVAELHQAMFADALFGEGFRRSAGIGGAAARRTAGTRRFWVAALSRVLELSDEAPG